MTAASASAADTRRERLLLLTAVVVTVVAWSSAFVAIRGVGTSIDGAPLALGRLLVGVVALGATLAVSRRWVRPNRREWLQLAVYGVGWFGLYNIGLNIAEQTLDAGTTSMLVNVGPILLAVGGALVFREGMNRWLTLGLAVAFVGAVVIGLASGARLTGGSGVLWAVGAAVAYTIGVLAQKPTLRRLPGGQVTFLGCAFGAAACLPFSGQLAGEVASAPPAALIGVLWLGLVPTAVAFSTWSYALGRMPAGRLGVSTYIVPPLVILLALLVFGELPAPLAVVGGAICLLGVAISRRRPRRATDEAQAPAAGAGGATAAPGAARS